MKCSCYSMKYKSSKKKNNEIFKNLTTKKIDILQIEKINLFKFQKQKIK